LKVLATARDLKRRKAREKNTLFVAEGIRCAEELLRSPLPLKGALVTGALGDTPRGAALLAALSATDAQIAEVAETDMASAAQTDSPQGVLLIAAIPPRELSMIQAEVPLRILVLDGIQDPGNAGTLLRTAAAFGINATIALPGTVDLWNAKVVRSAMGAHFSHCALHADTAEFGEFASAAAVEIWGSEAGAPPPSPPAELPGRIALVVGNEGAGLSSSMRALATRNVGIRMRGDVESLNVSVAAGILLHQLCQ
jgi:TrmH family RNA methyltransferase